MTMTIFDFLLACEWYKYQSDLHVIIFNHLQECCNSFVLLNPPKSFEANLTE